MKQAFVVWVSLGIGYTMGRASKPMAFQTKYPSGVILPADKH